MDVGHFLNGPTVNQCVQKVTRCILKCIHQFWENATLSCSLNAKVRCKFLTTGVKGFEKKICMYAT